MATLVLQVAGSVLGTMIGGPVGGMIGRAIGAVAGASIDSAVLNSHARAIEGPRLTEMPGLGSTEGAPIPRIYGRARTGGELIWATRFEEIVSVRRERGGNSGGKGSLSPGQKVRTYSYFANFAVGLCEGEIAYVRRIWADGKLLDLTKITMRTYCGTHDQMPDALIAAKEGSSNAPAYRGLAYVVFERMPLADYGNRIPQLSFEIIRPVGKLSRQIRGINLIPGAGEFAYAPGPVYRMGSGSAQQAENRNQMSQPSDFEASIGQLAALCPNLESVTLVVTWFGSDLRCGLCRIEPKVDDAAKYNHPLIWSVAGLHRDAAGIVSTHDGKPAFGGTPSDETVIQAIQALKSRGLKVNLHPFIMMDIPAGNNLPDPWTGALQQPPYPWRGEISVSPAPGQAGTADKTAAATAQTTAFFGAAQPQHFQSAGNTVLYSGPPEWSFRRFILHYAKIAGMAGGVDGFILSSELRGLTRVRGANAAFPAVEALTALANDVRAIVGSVPIVTYGADWTEYGAQVPEAGTVTFPLDGLWAAPAISCVGIDWYPPLSDWRDGNAHADFSVAASASDAQYLESRLTSGEAYDWYYANQAARMAQIRTPITDGAYGKPWIYRQKDLKSWWSNIHIPRSNGVETTATAWAPMSKPIWLLEIGCPAVDRGANAPNVFADPKSSASAMPYFSRGFRDDLVQARALGAIVNHYAPDHPDAAVNNPVSLLYGGRMVHHSRIHAWAWDARPFPAFPELADIWGDADNYQYGHWLNGRLEGAPLEDVLRAVAIDFGLDALNADPMAEFVDGYVIDRPMSARAAIEPLARLFGFGLSRSRLQLVSAGRKAAATLHGDDCVPDRDGVIFDLRRAQETELPAELTFGFSESESDYRKSTASARHLAGEARRQSFIETALVARRSVMQRRAQIRLKEMWIGRERVTLSLPPARVELEPGDTIRLADTNSLYTIQTIRDGDAREIEAIAVDPVIHDMPGADVPANMLRQMPAIAGIPEVEILDLPITRGEPPYLQYAAATAKPWLGAVAIWRRTSATEFSPVDYIAVPAVMGTLLDPLSAGPVWRWDRGNSLRVALVNGSVASLDEMDALAGGNVFAVRKNNGAWEMFLARDAVLEAPGVWRLSNLVRGLGASELAVPALADAGARIIKVDSALMPLSDQLRDIGQAVTWRIGPDGVDYADPRMIEKTATVPVLAMQPLPPVHVRARRSNAGIELSWIRQTRGEGDNWELADVPLAEAREAYEVDILSSAGQVLRTLSTLSPAVIYAAAHEVADLGTPQTALRVAVYQLSESAGRGQPRQLQCAIQ